VSSETTPPVDPATSDADLPGGAVAAAGEAPRSTATRPPLRLLGERLEELATPAHYLSLVLGLVVLLYLDRHLWFLGDIFEFFNRFQPGQSLNLFFPHNEHWSTIPILLNLGLYDIFGLRTYVPYIALDLVAHLAVAHLLWRWMLRLGSDRWIATALAAAFVVLGGGVENLTSSFQIGFVLPVVLGLLGAFLLDYSGPSRWDRDIGYWIIGVAAIMCSGIGVCVVLLGATLVLLRRGWLAALRAALVPAVVYLVWLALIGHEAISTTPAPKWELPQVAQYVWTGLTSAIEGTTGWTGLGGVLALGLGVWLYLNRGRAQGREALAFAGPPVALVFFAIIGVGRISLGVDEATFTHYAYEWVVLLLPATALVLTQLTHHSMTGRWVALGLTAVVAVNGIAGIDTWISANNPVQEQTEGQILAAAHLLTGGAPMAVGGDAEVAPVNSPNLTVSDLRSMIAAGKIPMSTPVTETDTLNASLYLQVSVTRTPLVTGSAPTVGTEVWPLPQASGQCVTVANGASPAPLSLTFSQPGSVAITPTGSGDVTAQLALEQTSLALTGSNSFPVTAGSTSYLNDTAAGTALLISLPAGVTTICGVSG
jgi:hypothetical protein